MKKGYSHLKKIVSIISEHSLNGKNKVFEKRFSILKNSENHNINKFISRGKNREACMVNDREIH